MSAADIARWVILAAAVLGALGVIATTARRARASFRNSRADAVRMRDAIVGRDAVLDSITGAEIAPALPGIGVRMAHQEKQMEAITIAVTKLASQQEAVVALQRTQEDHESRIKRLEDSTVERAVSRAESAAAWRAVEAAVKSEPPGESE